MQKGFRFDGNKCTGCHACVVACGIENELAPDTVWREIHTYNESRVPGVSLVHLSLACNHCAEPACLIHCPALAYDKDPETGAVTVDADKCIGCKYCSWVCPYDAPRYDANQGVMQKCTYCNDRVKTGLEPACIAYCPTGALQSADFDGVGKETSAGCATESSLPGFPSSSLGPAMELVPIAPNARIPEMESCGPTDFPGAGGMEGLPGPKPKIGLRSEWTLLVFTVLVPGLVGVFCAFVVGEVSVSAVAFVLAGFFGMGLSSLHLGKPMRAHRALLNWRRSWLSREVIGFGVFFSLASAVLLLSGELARDLNPMTGWAVAAVGFSTLFAMDMVYNVAATTTDTRFHSASVLLSGLLFVGVFAASAPLFVAVGAIKIALYGWRKFGEGGRSGGVGVVTTSSRIGLTVAAAILLLNGESEGPEMFAIAAAVSGEVIDRIEFYRELEIVTPAWKMKRDLAQEVGALEPGKKG